MQTHLSRVRVFTKFSHTHTYTQWVYFILFRYISPRSQSEIFLLEIYTHTVDSALFRYFFPHFLTTQLPLPAVAAAEAVQLNFTHKSIHNEIDGMLLLLTLLHLPTHTHKHSNTQCVCICAAAAAALIDFSYTFLLSH